MEVERTIKWKLKVLLVIFIVLGILLSQKITGAGRLLEIKLDMMSILEIEPQKGCLLNFWSRHYP